ncbi:D-alanyl-D-alanine carboxypeptidase/D-alanyl-D-alanine-endopeptidase [Sinomonas sp. ASV322]|uniref:D-alanyl-D-alanine carboxypeptidase/D-alanyl-D-alanine endopeptidase n=1 Tax=Sinomonas sp. ASV322 TaxID=3041920 RepID=UPI0027DC5FC9|nr:D-alanyl-D-alanine carboxypeptidase/D-alanyl-D-alanine-endopeptidase [Sinomonas sp. ASV322]MDQ4501422.1 D-alanyl-D-alanine carboxypeptidase/D-alanyl-D-alanine-endopeptidase [Sinomonas sp. ASV322]
MPQPFTRAQRAVTWVLASFLLVLAAAIGGAILAPVFPGPLLAHSAPDPSVPAWLKAPSSPAVLRGATSLADSAPTPAPAALAKAIDAQLGPDNGTFGAVVLDGATGQSLYSRAGAQPVAPASNLKLLTAAAVLRTLGPNATLTTRTVRGSTPNSIVLIAGGDVFLGKGESQPDAVEGHAGLATLARATAAALGPVHGTVSVQLDDSLFTGPALNPAWAAEDVAAGEIAPIAPIALNVGRTQPGGSGSRPADPALAAAAAFREALAAALGSDATIATGVARTTASGAAELASVASASVADQLAYTLRESDNYSAETLARLAAAATGRPASIDGARAALEDTAQRVLGSTSGIDLRDASGLAISDRIPAASLASLMRAMTAGDDARLRRALDGLPVAGLTGTLAARYGQGSAGAGFVRAKTGTLNTVVGLTGYVVDAEGRLLVFSFVGNGLAPAARPSAAAAVDGAASVLAGCGCR